ncbi:MAG: DUF1223 domain-containing protein [Caulobacteraceae bacterium]
MIQSLGRVLSAKAVAAFAGCALAWGLAAPAFSHGAPTTVVELYTAQGCAPCDKVERLVNRLAERPGIVVLTFPVDYWDYLGWPDTFAEPEFTLRQKAYDHRFDLSDVYTPQVIVDGEIQGSGAAPGGLAEMIDKARLRRLDPPQMRFLTPDRVAVGSARRPRGGAEAWLIRFDPKVQEVAVKTGDNRGRTIIERNVVRQLVRLGRWEGRPALYHAPPPPAGELSTLVLLQVSHGGRILGILQRQTTSGQLTSVQPARKRQARSDRKLRSRRKGRAAA